jgi:tetratricopeptide (TPR) repeat protein/predicted Ser/Thr protein kinase
MVGSQIQHYRIVRQLGAGGMGVVYEAEDTRLGRHVALKFLPDASGVTPEAVERFVREAKIASSLNHPNICTIYDIGEHDGRRFIVMELLEGQSLREAIHASPMTIDRVVELGAQIADALAAVHASGVIHRDLKPANIFITRRGQAKLLDFGVAKLSDERHASDTTGETHMTPDALTSPGSAIGSVNYMSPEQARGEDIDPRTDLFSLGVVLYEMATGRQAFSGNTTAVIFDQILNRQPVDPRQLNPDVPEDLQRIIARALEKDRRRRFQTAADLHAELARLGPTSRHTVAATAAAPVATQTQTTPPAQSQAAAPAAGRARPRRLWASIGLPAAVALAIGYAVWHESRTDAFAERDTVVVADFTNTTGDAVFDDALKQALTVQLEQTPFLTVLPDQRALSTLRLMQVAPDTPVRGVIARDLCQRAGAKASVEGSIAPLGASYVVTVGVHNCQTGASLAEQQAQASSKEQVLTTLGGITAKLRQHLGESLASIGKYDVPVTDATTNSIDALKAYGLATKTRYTKGDDASIPFYSKAIELDPNFALAYAKRAVVESNASMTEPSKADAEKAFALKDRVSEYERLYITYCYDANALGDTNKTEETLEMMVASYPNDYASRNNLGLSYESLNRFDDAVTEFKAAHDIAPTEPLPLGNLSGAYLQLGRVDEAFATAEQAQDILPTGTRAIQMWTTAVQYGRPEASKYEAAAVKLASPGQMEVARADVALWRGRLKEYAQIEDAQRVRARAMHNDGYLATLDAAELVTFAVFEGGDKLKALDAELSRTHPPSTDAQLMLVAAALGDAPVARAPLARLEPLVKSHSDLEMPVAITRAYVDAAAGRASDAVKSLEAFAIRVPSARELDFHLGRLREASGDAAGAENNYRRVIAEQAALGMNPVTSIARLSLGRLLTKKGDAAGARQQFDALLTQWKDSDTDFARLNEVRSLRKALGQTP